MIYNCSIFEQCLEMCVLGFLIEFVITFVLVLTVYAAAADDGNEVKGSAPLAIGLAIAIGHLFAVRISKLITQMILQYYAMSISHHIN